MLLAALLGFLTLGLGRPSVESPRKARPLRATVSTTQGDVVLVTIDSLRADHVGAYGYKRPTTPNFDRLARRGVRFERAYAQAPHTSFSIAALMTGRYFATLIRLVPEARFETLARRLGAHGWTTAAIYPPAVYVTDSEKLAPYAAEHFGFKSVRHDYLSADQSVDAAITFFERERPPRALLWLHLFEPHEPYEAGGELSFGHRDIDRYDQEVVVADAALGRLSQYLERYRPGAVLIVTSDHGEAFDEHNERYHGTNLHDEQLRVPLLIAAPDVKPRVVSEPVQLVDLFPTVLALTGTPRPSALDGHDLMPLIEGRSEEGRAAFAAVGDQLMIVRGKSKLILDLRQGTDQLLDLGSDPHELHDQSRERAAQAELLRSQLHRWVDDQLHGAERLRSSLAAKEVAEPILRARLGEAEAADSLANIVAKPGVLAERREAARLLVQLPPRLSTFSTLIRLQVDDPVLADWASVAALRLGFQPAQQQVERILTRAAPEFELRLRAAEALA